MKDSCKNMEEGRRNSINESSPAKKESSRRSRLLRRNKTVVAEPENFSGDGVNFKAKLIGTEPVGDARGNRMCQGALQRLKSAAKSSGDHKQRIVLNISLNGIMIKDEKTGDLLHHHPIHKISFISQDGSDNRAFGYVFGCPRSGHEFFAIKTEKMASHVVVTLRNLFLTALDIKKKELQEEEDSVAQSSSTVEKKVFTYPHSVALPDPPVDTLLDLQDFSVDSLQQGISHMEQSMAHAHNIIEDESIPLHIKLDKHLSSLYQQETLSISSRSSSTSDDPPPTLPPPPPPPPPPPVEDRYAVFLDIDSTPSIFDNPAIVNVPEPRSPIIGPQATSSGVTENLFTPPKRAVPDPPWSPFNPFSAPPPLSPPPPPPRPPPLNQGSSSSSTDQPPLPSPARKMQTPRFSDLWNRSNSEIESEWPEVSPPLPPKPSIHTLMNTTPPANSNFPVEEPSPDSIFRRKSDPFADDFFLSLAKAPT